MYICRLKISYSIQKQKVYLKRVYEYSLIKQIKFILLGCAAREWSYFIQH